MRADGNVFALIRRRALAFLRKTRLRKQATCMQTSANTIAQTRKLPCPHASCHAPWAVSVKLRTAQQARERACSKIFARWNSSPTAAESSGLKPSAALHVRLKRSRWVRRLEDEKQWRKNGREVRREEKTARARARERERERERERASELARARARARASERARGRGRGRERARARYSQASSESSTARCSYSACQRSCIEIMHRCSCDA
eukprot:6173364-Pleurochrysis_carterae.AAC.9